MFLGLRDAFFFIFSVRQFWRKGGGLAVDPVTSSWSMR